MNPLLQLESSVPLYHKQTELAAENQSGYIDGENHHQSIDIMETYRQLKQQQNTHSYQVHMEQSPR